MILVTFVSNKNNSRILWVVLVCILLGCSENESKQSIKPTPSGKDKMTHSQGFKSESEQTFYVVNPTSPWAEFGKPLVHGSVSLQGPVDGKLQLYRAGAIIPPVTMPSRWALIVTDETRPLFERAFGQQKFEFNEVAIAKAVDIDWPNWNTDNEVKILPPGGDPVSYLTENENDDKIMSRLPKTWQIVLPRRSIDSTNLELEIWKGEGIFISTFAKKIRYGNSFVVVTENGKEKLSELSKGYLEFVDLEDHKAKLNDFRKMFNN